MANDRNESFTMAQDHTVNGYAGNPSYAVGRPQSDGSDWNRPVVRGDTVTEQRQDGTVLGAYPTESEKDAKLRVPTRYGRERLQADQSDSLVYAKHSHNPAPDPRWNPAPTHQVASHKSYRFYRKDFGLDVPYPLVNKGDHFSMANHRRDYPVLGMEAVPNRRNTYRTQPPPRDVTIQDRPAPAKNTTPQETYYAPTTGYSMFGNGARKYRL